MCREPGKKVTPRNWTIRVVEGAHQLALPHELAHGLGQILDCPAALLQEGVDGFGGGGHRESHLVHSAIGPSADHGPSELNVRENGRLQFGMAAEKTGVILDFNPSRAEFNF